MKRQWLWPIGTEVFVTCDDGTTEVRTRTASGPVHMPSGEEAWILIPVLPGCAAEPGREYVDVPLERVRLAPSAETSATIEAAVAWWADVLGRAPVQQTGDGVVNARLRDLAPEPLTADEREAFKAALHTWLLNCLVTNQSAGLSVDYGPDEALQDAYLAARPVLEKATPFPVKTHMHVEPGYVTVARGYAAAHQLVYGASRWDVVLNSADYKRTVPYQGPDETEARRVFARSRIESHGGSGELRKDFSRVEAFETAPTDVH